MTLAQQPLSVRFEAYFDQSEMELHIVAHRNLLPYRLFYKVLEKW